MLSSTVQALLRSPLFIISATTLICLLLSTNLLQQQHEQRLNLRTDHYGNALASLAAKQATDATLNHDLVSLQVTVSDVAKNPHVLSTTIHDVESRLLVQAGKSPNTGDYSLQDQRSFSAPITLHDSVAGYVTVTIDNQALLQQQDDAWLLGLLGLASALLLLSLLNARQTEAPTSDTGEGAPSNASTPSPQTSEEATTATDGSIVIALGLHCLNWEQLKQQLSGPLKQQVFDQLESHLSGINALYSGKVACAQDDYIELHFCGDDLGNTTFRALCAAQLLFQLLESGCASIQLQYSGAIFRCERALHLKQHMHNHRRQQQLLQTLQRQQPSQLLLDGQDCATSQLLLRVKANAELVDQQWFDVERLQPSYQQLLDKQVQQLQQLQSA